MVITVSHQGYIKRTPLTEYRTQGRGGVGSRAASSKEDDFTEHLFIASMHNYLLIFMASGRMYWQKVYSLPEGSRTSKGRPIQNVINVEPGDKVRSILNVKTLKDPDYVDNHYIVMVTEQGVIKKTSLEAFSRPRQAGLFAININDDDRLLDVKLTDGNCDIILAKRSGKAVRFAESQVRPMGRGATGVRGVTLEGDTDVVVGVVAVAPDDTKHTILVISENGYGKRSPLAEYPTINRGGKGVKTLNVTDKTGNLVGILGVEESDEIMIINKSGISIRIGLDDLREMGRNTQGVRLLRLNEGDSISSVAIIKPEALDDSAKEIGEGSGDPQPPADEISNENGAEE